MRQAIQAESAPKTVLVVDDEPQILSIVSGFLCGQYHVLTAKSGPDALQQSKKFKGEIHVLLSDFQMAGMTGIELATRITLARPKIKVLLMSSYSEGMLVLNEGWHFLPKPFVLSQLRSLVGGLMHPSRTLVATLRSTGKAQLAHGLKPTMDVERGRRPN
jgi:two-component system cell cycle response regulator CpdR